MEVKDKALLIKDLSGRLPYGVWVEHIRTGMRGHLHDLKVYPLYDKTDDHIYDYICSTDFLGDGDYFDIEAFKPLLFPLSSMNEEQKKELEELGLAYYTKCEDIDDDGVIWVEKVIQIIPCTETDDWLLEHHFDHRGLIDKGLALDATGLGVY